MAKSNVWGRKRARRALVQAIYQWQMAGGDATQLTTDMTESGGLKKADLQFFDEVLRGVVHHSAEYDALLGPLLDRGVNQLDKVELAILRLGTCELKERIDVPYRVVLDEYVELAKTFGAEDGHKYVNGVLDRLAKDLRTIEVNHHARGGA